MGFDHLLGMLDKYRTHELSVIGTSWNYRRWIEPIIQSHAASGAIKSAAYTHSNWRPEPLKLVCEQPISALKENNISADVTLTMLNPHTFRDTECRREPHMPATAGVESVYKFRRRKHDWHLQCMFCKVFGEEGKKSLGSHSKSSKLWDI